MYVFRDTKETSTETSWLPNEAMSYDGVYLENEIDGYRTLSVSGRELKEASITENTIDGMNGSNFQWKTYEPRTITVQYQLIAESDSAFRSAFNKLNKLLNKEQVKVIFNDERDKYFIGTKTGNTTVDTGRNAVIGELEIYCTDPFKYALNEKTFETSTNTLTIENEGSMPAEISYEITNTEENGYLGIVSDSGVMEYGFKQEADGEDYRENELLADLQDMIDCKDDVGGYDCMHPNYGTKGTLTVKNWWDTDFLALGTIGEKYTNSNGGLRTFTLPADSNGDFGCTNWYSYFRLVFYAGQMGQVGEMSISFITDDNKLVAGCNWYKTDMNGNTGQYDFVVYNPNMKSTDLMAGRVLRTFTYTTSHVQAENPWYFDWGHCDLKKEGNQVTFFYWGGYYTYTVPEIEDMKVAKVQIACKLYGSNESKLLGRFGFDNFTFQKMHVDKWRDVPNRYPKGSIITIDGEEGKFYLDGMHKPSEEVLGTTYFKSPSGESTINFHVSDWIKENPTIKATIRERWL